MKKIELEIKEILNRVSKDTALVVLLREKGGRRALPIMVGPLEAQAIAITMFEMKMPRPGVFDLLINVAETLGAHLKEVQIYRIEGGIFYSNLVFEKSGDEIAIDSRTSDAISVALRAGVPIVIDDEMLDECCMKEDSHGAFSMPISAVTIDVLQDALNNAVKSENYELAAKLRDEIKKRNDKLD